VAAAMLFSMLLSVIIFTYDMISMFNSFDSVIDC
jgi:hypothetical protein